MRQAAATPPSIRPASASRAALDLLVPGDVLVRQYRFAHSVLYAGSRGLIALTDHAASRSTCAVRVDDAAFTQLADAECLLVGDRSLVAPAGTIQIRRTWRCTLGRLAAPPRPIITELDAALQATPRGLPHVLSLDPPELVGLGTGLTPSGDDILCGALAAAHAWGDGDALAQLWVAIAPRLSATTTLSAQFLADAREGDVAAELRDLLVGLSRSTWRPAYDTLVRVGHTSGADLAHGVLLFLQQLDYDDEGDLDR